MDGVSKKITKYGVTFKVTYDQKHENWPVNTRQGIKCFRDANAALFFLMWSYVEEQGENPFVFFANEIIK